MINILKSDPGMDPANRLGERLGEGFRIRDFDPALQLADQLSDVDVLIVRDASISSSVIDRAPNLKLIQRMGEHVSSVDIAHATSRGIHVARVPASALSTRLVAEHALFLLLALAKRFPESRESVMHRRLAEPQTTGLFGKTLGIVGLGRSGRALVGMAQGLGMNVAAIRRVPTEEEKQRLGLVFLGGMDQCDEMLGQCDAVSIHLPLKPETRGWFGDACFDAMRPGAFLVNVARGAIVDRPALESALEAGRLGGAAFDVFWDEPASPDDPLLTRQDFILTPHLAGFTREAEDRLINGTAENIRRIAAGEIPDNLVEPPAKA